jgi:hypothetical protein
MNFWLSTMPAPDFLRHPIDWLHYRLKVASEFETIEWWYRDNLVFVSALLCFLVVAAVLVVLWLKRRKRV